MRVAVLGGGSWGTALALLLDERGENVVLWTRSTNKKNRLNEERENRDYLPGISLPDSLEVSDDLSGIVAEADGIVFAVPSKVTAGLAAQVATSVSGSPLIVLTAKGFEPEKRRRLSVTVADFLPRPSIAVLAGPSHAEEVARRVPTTVVATGFEQKAAVAAQELFATDRFRVYTNHDLVGVELATALKNVIALAAGICDGLGFGDNTKGALLTRGLAEITRLGIAMGAEPSTFAGLAGMGDLITTCMSRHSRNRRFGEEVAKGKSVERIQEEMIMVAEGVGTARIAAEFAAEHGVEMPITTEVELVLYHDKPPMKAMADLMNRNLKAEVW